MAANVLTIPAGAPFAETLARGLIDRLKPDGDPLALSRTTIYLPTRRAARNFAEVFARILGGAALLPDMRPLGDVDEDEFLFDTSSDDIDFPPAIPPIRRHLLLAALVRRWDQTQRDGTLSFAQAASLARGLAGFFDEAETQGADLSKLADLAPGAFAQHWDEVKGFLEFLNEQWPAILESEGALNPADRRNRVLSALARRLEANPPSGPVIAAGSTGSIPATAQLLRAIAHLPQGAVVLPGLDRELDEDSWRDLDEGHPQYGMRQLLRRMDVARKHVGDWQPVAAGNPPRETLLRETLRSAPTTDAWRGIAESGASEIEKGLEGLSTLEAAHPGDEAASIALILREALEIPLRTAALVTPDRNLARRVSAEMTRWNIAIDDSAGRPLANTPPGTFLTLLAETAEAKFAPVPLLALLKHPLASGGENTAKFRRHARELDRFVLRGPRPDPGLDGIAHAMSAVKADAENHNPSVAKIIPALASWFARLSEILHPLEEAMAQNEIDIATLLSIHIATAEALAATDVIAGKDILWRADAGNEAAELVAALEGAARDIPKIESGSYPVLIRALAEGRAVRPVFGRHPRLAILGPLEARLQSFDVIVLGGLNESTWPASAATDPWLSRPMRTKLGLEQPERAIGLAAHDFATLAAGPRVILTRALKAEGSPTIASRWLQRLIQLTKGLKLDAKLAAEKPYEQWSRALNEPAKPAEAMKRPQPKPPVTTRPRGLSVTEIETWLRDPYAIYAKHILRLRPLDPLDAEIGPLERGTAVHLALERFLIETKSALPQDAAQRLIAIADDIFRETNVPRSALAIWQPRFERAAHWFVDEERKRRTDIRDMVLEIKGTREFSGAAGAFILRCRADRIDILTSGGAAIVDYKTGAVPSNKQIASLLAPQLLLEGAILAGNGFPPLKDIVARELLYIQISGGKEPGKTLYVDGDIPALVTEAEAKLVARIADFDRQEKPYDAQVAPVEARRKSDYAHLERVREWLAGGWEGADA
jgi:ATP-dependent helicase/nuclease subunit B